MSPTVSNHASVPPNSRHTNPHRSSDDLYHRESDDTKTAVSPTRKSLSLLKKLSFHHIQAQSQSSQANMTDHGNSHSDWDPDVESQQRQQPHRSKRSRSSKKEKRHKSRDDDERRREKLLDEFRDDDADGEPAPYIVKQSKGHFAIGFSMVQTVVLALMMIQCSIAPFQLNPMIGPPPDALDYWGGKNALKIIDDNEVWRLITPIFLHAGIIHLLCNVSVQLDIGELFEREWGSRIWLFIYLTSALGSSIWSCCMMPDNISVGSSGAVMGLFGGKLGEIFCRACESKKTVQGRIGHEIRKEQLGACLCSVASVMAFSFVPFVDWAAHLGGLIAGFTSAFLCFAPAIKTKFWAVFWFIIGVAMNVGMYTVLLTYMYTQVDPMDDLDDICGYYQQFFEGYECVCQKD